MTRMVVGRGAARLLLAVTLVALLASGVIANSLGIPDTEYNALVALYNSTNGPGWTASSNWLSVNTPWYGVTVTGGHVTRLILHQNELSGTIPPEIGNLTKLECLYLDGNLLGGSLPSEIGNLANLNYLSLSSNQIVGDIPHSIVNLNRLFYYGVAYNGLYSTDPAVLTFMAARSADWQSMQTVPPTNISTWGAGAGSAVVSLTPIAYARDSGYYEVGIGQTSGGPYTFSAQNRTASKSDSQLTVTGLGPDPNYLVVRTVTLPSVRNTNTVTSVLSPEVQSQASNALGIPNSEYQALVALYNSTNGPGWADNGNWLTDNTPWTGVTVEEGHVTTLALYTNGLTGAIPSGLSVLTKLENLWLSGNQLSGTIPSAIAKLTNLQTLDLSSNQLSGTIPTDLGSLANLQVLVLDTNHLSGTIPTEIGDLTNLQSLVLNDNELSGTMPAQLGNLTNLTELDLNNNQLSGTIPSQFGNLASISLLELDNNQLSGAIPSAMGKLTNLRDLYIENNQLSGSIPSEIGDMTKLQSLYLDSNQLSGSIPSQLGNLTHLGCLGLRHNQLSGSIPSQLGNAQSLWQLDLCFNQLSGPIPPELCKLYRLNQLYLNNNQLSGTIPSEFGNLAHLYYLNLSSNQLVGDIPASIVNLNSISTGYFPDSDISYNGLSSSDPAVLTFMEFRFPGWKNTQTVPPAGFIALDLGSGNAAVSWTPIVYTADDGHYEVGISHTSGGPYTFSPQNQTTTKSASQITVTGLGPAPNYLVIRTVTPADSNNQNTVTSALSAEVQLVAPNPFGVPDSEYQALVTLYNSTNGPHWTNSDNWLSTNTPWYGVTVAAGHVTSISLGNNQLSGTIPSQISDLTGLQQLDLGNNQVTGTMPSQIGDLASLQTLCLQNNQLIGPIPPQIGSLANLQYLDLHTNQLSGSLPSEIGNLTNLQHLALQSNQIVGTVPPSIVNLTKLVPGPFTSVSYNGLSSSDPSVLASMDVAFPDWQDTQTVPPTGLTASASGSTSAVVSWTPIIYSADAGHYEVGVSQTSGGPYTFNTQNITVSKSVYQLTTTGLVPGTNYLVVRTLTPANSNNQNVVTSLPSSEVRVTVPNPFGIPDAECEALAALYTSTNGPNWIHADNWLTANTPWYGLTVIAGHVTSVSLPGNQLSGPIPSQLGNLTSLLTLSLNGNQLSGPIPSLLGNLTKLQTLNLFNDQLSGPIPPELGNLSNLQTLNIYNNQLSGTIPPDLGKLTNLQTLSLYGNHLNGPIPSEIGNLTNLQHLSLQSNQLIGSIPSSITNLTKLAPGLTTRVSYNALSSADPPVLAFMTAKFSGWQNTQTVPPTGLVASGLGSGNPIVSWTPIVYTADTGYYEVGISQTKGGPYTFSTQNRTADKAASQITVTGLAPGVNYLVARTVTLPCGYNLNTVTSLLSSELRAAAGLNKSGPDMAAQAVVTAVFTDGSYYVETPDRSCGIRAAGGTPPMVGDLVQIAGTLSVSNGEVQVNVSSCDTLGQASMNPIGMPARALGGGPFGLQAGITGSTGLSNIGLLVRVWGRVTEIGNGCLYIDDASNWIQGSRGGDRAHVGVMVLCDPSSRKNGDYLSVTGISSCYTTPGGQIEPRVLTRGAGDITEN